MREAPFDFRPDALSPVVRVHCGHEFTTLNAEMPQNRVLKRRHLRVATLEPWKLDGSHLASGIQLGIVQQLRFLDRPRQPLEPIEGLPGGIDLNV
jgi:hypothetical protein